MSAKSKTKHRTEHNVNQVVISHKREEGLRWIAVHSNGWRERALAERLLDASAEFSRSVDLIKPILATLRIGDFETGHYQTIWEPGSSPIPFVNYEWRNYVTPEFADGRPLGNGELLDEPMFVDVGQLPFVELVERNRLQRMLEPLLPKRQEVPRGRDEFGRFGVRVQAAAKDDGIELPEDLRAWAASVV